MQKSPGSIYIFSTSIWFFVRSESQQVKPRQRMTMRRSTNQQLVRFNKFSSVKFLKNSFELNPKKYLPLEKNTCLVIWTFPLSFVFNFQRGFFLLRFFGEKSEFLWELWDEKQARADEQKQLGWISSWRWLERMVKVSGKLKFYFSIIFLQIFFRWSLEAGFRPWSWRWTRKGKFSH